MTESEEKSSRSRRRRRASASALKRRRLFVLAALLVAAGLTAAIVVPLVVFVFDSDGPSDEDAIESLAQRSIEVLPAGEWPFLYDSFVSEYQARCPRLDFNRAGVEAANQLDLQSLRFLRVEALTVEESTALAVIVGEESQQGEYKVQAEFRKESGEWKLAPAAGTQGCEAFRPADG